MLPKALLLGIPSAYITSFSFKHNMSIRQGKSNEDAVTLAHTGAEGGILAFSVVACCNHLYNTTSGRPPLTRGAAGLASFTILQMLIGQAILEIWNR